MVETLLLIKLSPFWGGKVYKLKDIEIVISLKIEMLIFFSVLFVVFCYSFILSIASFIFHGT